MTVTVEMEYLEKLIRDSEKLKVIERHIEGSNYLSERDMKSILGVSEGKEN